RPSKPGTLHQELMEVKECFGTDVPHVRSDKRSGVSTICIENNFPNHFGTTNIDTGLHTDGTYSENSPKVVIHQCEIPSETGGESQLASCRRVYREMVEHHPKELGELLFPPHRTFSIRRENDSNTTSVLSWSEDGRIEATFRSNFSTKDPAEFSYPSDRHKEAFEVFAAIAHREDSVLTFKMKKHDILILDNASVLHGRTEFPEDSKRKLNRLLLNGNIESSSKVLSIGFYP
ncbi:MAG: TauD/TfdA family dioxygenase, partial [Cyanobacteria bacterium J06555_13]